MQPRGTNVWRGQDAKKIRETETKLREFAIQFGFEEIILPNFWSLDTFTAKAGGKLTNTMYTFKDKGNRDMVLIPEATALVTELYDAGWNKSEKKPIRLFYIQRCYRYDKPQAGRYREFTQFGIEILGTKDAYEMTVDMANQLIAFMGLAGQTVLNTNPERGIHYYNGRTFEIEAPGLGAQKQLFGGGEYEQGAGFGIGVERLIMVKDVIRNTP